ncbi:kinase-like protein, partial [Punctularia strigosozonata HHB-11173 SS5]|uniref:kinase-like protein n=1 Tax=Punctularia strigosozonata (strain HHB-11173) TaxID=741275 RepID=UPI0004417ECF
HPNIVPFLDVSSGIQACIVSQWMENGDVMSYLERFPDSSRRELILDIAHGLEYMRANGLIHGDMKSRNVLVDAKGRALLSDFGLAATILGTSSLVSSTGESANWGTWRYMAPELLDPKVEIKVLTMKADTYGSGMTAWEVWSPIRTEP